MADATRNCCRLGARSMYTMQSCTSLLSLAVAATSIIFAATKYFCCDKRNIFATKVLLRQAYFCHDKHVIVATKHVFCRHKSMHISTKPKHTFVATKEVFCRDKHVFVATYLSPALLAEWPGSFTCYFSNTGVERIPK